MIVATPFRDMGIGSTLMQALETWAYQQGHSQAWVATSGRAIRFYQNCGWKLTEHIERLSGERMSILTKSLSA
jgi:GNAT superfamily N-acetyltransferase